MWRVHRSACLGLKTIKMHELAWTLFLMCRMALSRVSALVFQQVQTNWTCLKLIVHSWTPVGLLIWTWIPAPSSSSEGEPFQKRGTALPVTEWHNIKFLKYRVLLATTHKFDFICISKFLGKFKAFFIAIVIKSYFTFINIIYVAANEISLPNC